MKYGSFLMFDLSFKSAGRDALQSDVILLMTAKQNQINTVFI